MDMNKNGGGEGGQRNCKIECISKNEQSELTDFCTLTQILAGEVFYCEIELLIEQNFTYFVLARDKKTGFLCLPFLNVKKQSCRPFEYVNVGPSCSEDMPKSIALPLVVLKKLIW